MNKKKLITETKKFLSEAAMSELEYCEVYCGKLTREQKAMLAYNVKIGRFVGVATAYAGASNVWYPAVWKKNHAEVINHAGYYDNVSVRSTISYEYEMEHGIREPLPNRILRR